MTLAAGIDHVQSFAPLANPCAHSLVLGSMPGIASLDAAQYYAHPRNAFWPIVHALATGQPPSFDAVRSLDYSERCDLALRAGLAVWDVLASCKRPGSLDSAIELATAAPNDIATLVSDTASLKHIVLNGQTAARLFKKHLADTVAEVAHTQCRTLELHVMPSTSPAMASLNLAQKFAKWRVIARA